MIPGLGINAAEASVLLLLRADGPLRFTGLQDRLGRNPATVDRALKSLTKHWFVVAETVPTEGRRIPVQYRLSRRGEAATRVLDALAQSIREHEDALGRDAVDGVQALWAD